MWLPLPEGIKWLKKQISLLILAPYVYKIRLKRNGKLQLKVIHTLDRSGEIMCNRKNTLWDVLHVYLQHKYVVNVNDRNNGKVEEFILIKVWVHVHVLGKMVNMKNVTLNNFEYFKKIYILSFPFFHCK
jgi:hypothetical protein